MIRLRKSARQWWRHGPVRIDILLAALNDADPVVRKAVVAHELQYANNRDARMTSALLTIAGNQQDPLRAEAITAFHGSTDSAVFTALLKIAADPADPAHDQALTSLDLHADKPMLDQLLALLPTASPTLRTAILTTIAGGDDPRLTALFLPLLHSDDAGERLLALKTLSRSADAAVVQELLALLKARVTANDLEPIAQLKAYQHLTAELPLPSQLALTLLHIGDPAIDSLDTLLTDANPLLRAAGAALLIQGQEPRSIPDLVAALRDEDARVRAYAAEALRTRADVSALPALLAAVPDREPRVRLEAICALGAIQDMRAETTLLGLLKDPSADIQLAAVCSVMKLADPHAAQPLLDSLSTAKDDTLRAALLHALGILCEPRVTDAALAALHSENYLLHANAIFALGMVKAKRAVSPLCMLVAQPPTPGINDSRGSGVETNKDSLRTRCLSAEIYDLQLFDESSNDETSDGHRGTGEDR